MLGMGTKLLFCWPEALHKLKPFPAPTPPLSPQGLSTLSHSVSTGIADYLSLNPSCHTPSVPSMFLECVCVCV